MRTDVRVLLSLILSLMLALNFSGCFASSYTRVLPQPSRPEDGRLMVRPVADPLEPLNRLTFTVNELAFHTALNPAVKGYNAFVPEPARKGVRNFRNNLFFPLRFVSSLLQGKPGEAGMETQRFLINSTLGIGGLGDPAAKKFDLHSSNEDMGQTLGAWGWDSQMYLFLPLIGPSSERDALGEVGDALLDPASLFPPGKTGMAFNRLSFDAKGLEQLLATYYDPYEITRLLYTINREIAVRDAEPDEASEDTGQTQTMMAVFARPQNAHFGGKARERSVRPTGFIGSLPYSIWLQKGPAPLMFVLPGLGAHRKGARSLTVAELAHKEGYHVVGLSNNFNWEFIRHAPAGYLPGYTPRDVDLIQRAHQAIQQDLKARYGMERIQGKSLIGFSMGAWYALNLAAQNPPGTYQHSLAINPPLDLVHGLKVLDGLYRAPQGDDLARLKAIQQSAFTKVLLNQKSDPRKGLKSPFTDAEASHLIGLSYRITLREAILTGKFDKLLAPIMSRQRLYNRINSISYEDYYEKMIKPDLEARNISATKLNVVSDIRHRRAELARADSVHLFLTGNDFLLTSEHLAWYRKNFPRRHTYNETGGHMGNLWESRVQDALRKVIRREQSQVKSVKISR